MKKNFSGKLFYFLLIPLVILSSFTIIADRVDFSGEWKLDESKSDFGQFGQFAARTLKVAQNDHLMTVDRTIPGFNGGEDRTVTYSVTFDGKETESEGFGGSKRKSTAQWSDDGQTLTINNMIHFDRNGQTFDVKSTETWTMGSDGLLTIVNQTSSPQGDATTKAVYSK